MISGGASCRLGKQSLRVLVVSDVYFPRVNGVSTSIETFRHALRAHGVDATLVVPRYAAERDEQGVIRVPGMRVPRDPEDRIASWRRMRAAARSAASRCDLVHVQTPFAAHYAGLAAARDNGLPVVATYHTLFEEYLHHYVPLLPAPWLRALARRISRSQCNALDAVLVPSAAMRDRLTHYGVTTPLEVLPTGIPLERFQGGDARRFRSAHGLPEDRPLLLFVGRVAHEKNVPFLFDALERVLRRRPEAILLVAGEGPALADLRREAAERGLAKSVRFVGYLRRDGELADCYAAATLFVFASRTETQGLVLLEAMATGTPVVALSEMGTKDVLGPGLGCVTPPDDAQDFADAIVTLLDSPQVRRKLSEEATAYASQWSDDAIAAKLARYYRSLVLRGISWKAPSRERPASGAF